MASDYPMPENLPCFHPAQAFHPLLRGRLNRRRGMTRLMAIRRRWPG